MVDNGTVYGLWRQDDNGNRFLVATFTGREEAERRLAELASLPHRQIYWLEAVAEPAR